MLDGRPKKLMIRPRHPVSTADVLIHFFEHPPYFTTMNFRLCTGLAAIVSISLVSCYPYDESQHKKKATKAAEKTTASAEQVKAKEKEELKKKQDEELKKKEELAKTIPAENPTNTAPAPTETPKPSVEPKRTEYPVASKVPGKEGYVFSPYNNKIISVRDEQDRLIPSGTLVQDPTFPPADKKYFRVP